MKSSTSDIKNRRHLKRYIRAALSAFLLLIILIGTLLIFLSLFISQLSFWHCEEVALVLKEMGILCITITPILYVYEFLMRRHFNSEMKLEIEDVLNNVELQEKVIEVLQRSLPLSYQNILKNGISNAYPEFDVSLLLRMLQEANNTEIKMIKIWLAFIIDNGIEEKVFVDCIIKQGCKFKIVLYDYDNSQALIARSKTASTTFKQYDAKKYSDYIKANLDYFSCVWAELNSRIKKESLKINAEECFQVRLHDDFISTSLIGTDSYYVFGTYLHGRLSNRGVQFQIDKMVEAKETEFYRQLENHFQIQWEVAHKRVIFLESQNKKWETVLQMEMPKAGESLTD